VSDPNLPPTNLPNFNQPLTINGVTSGPWYRFFGGIAPQGNYSATFQSGYVQYTGPQGTIQANINFIVGTNIPNPSGTPGACLLLGSGGGNGTPTQAWIISDQAYDDQTPGNLLGITAGETQPAGSADGGELLLLGGASFGGTGGLLQLQGGTSLNGNGGETVVQGGNSTNGNAGDVFLTGGQAGQAGANVHLIATLLNSIAGVIRLRSNSNIMIDFIPVGSASGGNQPVGIYLYSGGGYGSAGQPLVSGGSSGSANWLSTGFTGSITFGTGHTMTVANGLITGYS